MLDALVHTLADKEYYAPPAAMADPGPRFAPARVPYGWRRVDRDIWTVWSDGQARRAEQGWKIHVSARLDRTQRVLDTVAEIRFAEGVLFKHVSARTFFTVLHHKHASRPQAGKFCAIYPPDTETARRLLGLLSDALREEDGPYVLSDRRFGDSRTVHYRYGAFSARTALLPDGTRQGLVRDGFGRDVPDERLPYFLLPDGIADPFVAEEPEPHQGSILIRDYEIAGALQPSNAGGAYLARDTRTGRRVFIKEARAHNGLTMDGTDAQTRLRHEHKVLAAVHAAAPGICPEPLDHFREWEHDFLVTEYLEGVALRAWLSSTSSLMRTGSSAADHAVFFDAARRVLAALGHLDEAIDLAEHTEAHPITASCSTLSGGRAGVGLTWLARAMPYLAVGRGRGGHGAEPLRRRGPGRAPPRGAPEGGRRHDPVHLDEGSGPLRGAGRPQLVPHALRRGRLPRRPRQHPDSPRERPASRHRPVEIRRPAHPRRPLPRFGRAPLQRRPVRRRRRGAAGAAPFPRRPRRRGLHTVPGTHVNRSDEAVGGAMTH